MRYTDEGEILELCKWTVDLRSLPTFQQNAQSSGMAGFYTEFELGLELDSVEVRGILLYQGQEWGRYVSSLRLVHCEREANCWSVGLLLISWGKNKLVGIKFSVPLLCLLSPSFDRCIYTILIPSSAY